MDPRTKAQRLILRGYGPLAGLVVVLLFLTMLVPSRPLSTVTLSGAADTPAAAVPLPTADGADGAADATTVPVGDEAVTGTTMAAATAASGPAATTGVRPGTRTSASGAPGAARAGGPAPARAPATRPTRRRVSTGTAPTTAGRRPGA